MQHSDYRGERERERERNKGKVDSLSSLSLHLQTSRVCYFDLLRGKELVAC